MLYRTPPDSAMLAENGLSSEDFEADYTAEIWPENERSVDLFLTMRTQWRIGFGGATGLDYGVFPQILRMHGIPRPEWPALFFDLQVLEDGALLQMQANPK